MSVEEQLFALQEKVCESYSVSVNIKRFSEKY